ncbi:MAG: MFS transporter, partial [Methanocorpusculum sp.]|nr:MFS transporter [Methanocorpusculum sp.]
MTSLIADKRQQILLLIAISLAALMDGLDGSIVNIALPVIAADFGADTGTVSWIVITYLLMVAGTILIFGNIAARGHIKKTFVIGFALFTAASALCGFSPSLEMLTAARIIQGIGASMIIACAPIICVKFLPSNILGLSFGVLTAATSVGFALGPAIGGILTHYLSWHWIFLINIPVGIFAIFYVLHVVPKGIPEQAAKFDIRGAVLLFIAMASGVFVLERFPHLGAANPAIIGLSLLCL